MLRELVHTFTSLFPTFIPFSEKLVLEHYEQVISALTHRWGLTASKGETTQSSFGFESFAPRHALMISGPEESETRERGRRELYPERPETVTSRHVTFHRDNMTEIEAM